MEDHNCDALRHKMERENLDPYHQQHNLRSGNSTILKLCGWPNPFNEFTHEVVVFSDYELNKISYSSPINKKW